MFETRLSGTTIYSVSLQTVLTLQPVQALCPTIARLFAIRAFEAANYAYLFIKIHLICTHQASKAHFALH